MTLTQDIAKTKKRLIAKWKRGDPYENFGQKELRDLEDKYDYFNLCYSNSEEIQQAKLIDAFGDWCMNYTGNE